MKILIVDDEQDLAYVLSEILSQSGFNIVTASNGVMALEKLKTEVFDLVLSDIDMPVMDGKELLKIISQQYAQLPVCLCTGSSIHNKQELLAAGAKAVIEKPFPMDSLLNTIKSILKHKDINELINA